MHSSLLWSGYGDITVTTTTVVDCGVCGGKINTVMRNTVRPVSLAGAHVNDRRVLTLVGAGEC